MSDHSRISFKQKFFNILNKYLLRLTAFPSSHENLIQLLRVGETNRLMDAQSLFMIESILQVSEIRIRDIMIPRSQMVVIDAELSFEEILPIVVESGHSRFPVIEKNRDEVVGILLAKDLLAYMLQREKFDIYEIVRTPIFVPDSKRLNLMLQDFRRSRNHMAIIVDEYGHASGLVTIEDILEQIVGEIEDEYDVDDEMLIKKHSETQFIVKGLTQIQDFNNYFGCQLNEEEFDTVGGLVIQALGHLPRRGESVVIEKFRFRVLYADSRRIRLLRVTLLK
jgi:magnesium and cobalt transporter